MVIHGRPDWVRSTTLQDVRDVFGNIPQVGMGELAARLGSIKHYEKRGEVIFMDDFEASTLKWVTGGTGTGHAEVRSNASSKGGNYSMKLVTGNLFENRAYIQHYGHQPVMKKLGFEFSFALGSNLWFVFNSVYIYDGTYKYTVRLSYSPYYDKLYVIDEEGTGREIATGLALKEHNHLYHTWKQTYDLETEKYVRCYLDHVDYDISEYSFQKTEDNSPAHLLVEIEILTATDANNYTHFDNIIITQNEP